MRIAVVGSGIAGLSASWLLSCEHDVTLYEAAASAGGHAHTVDVTLDGVTHPVDTGFLVFNDRTYPELVALFETLGVRSVASDMSFSVRIGRDGLEWAGTSVASVFAQRRNMLRPRFLSMLGDIARFNRTATRMVRDGGLPQQTLGDWLAHAGYGAAFREWYLVPMLAAIWSTPPGRMLDFPVAPLLRFCHNHGLLAVSNRPRWRTVMGGSRDYVQRMVAGIGEVCLATPVARIERGEREARLVFRDGHRRTFDQVILACHSDQALALLADPSPAERDVLGAIPYQPNRAVLHTDASLLPRRRGAWAAWNYHLDDPAAAAGSVSVSYLINHLQPLPFRRPVIVTLNPGREPEPGAVLGRFDYDHPLFTAAVPAAQARLPALQGLRRTWFCGAWTRYGFHEDGLMSGMDVAGRLGAMAPWVRAAA